MCIPIIYEEFQSYYYEAREKPEDKKGQESVKIDSCDSSCMQRSNSEWPLAYYNPHTTSLARGFVRALETTTNSNQLH